MEPMTIRIRSETKESLEERADEYGISVSEYVRQLIDKGREYDDMYDRLESRRKRIDALEEQLARRQQIEEKIDDVLTHLRIEPTRADGVVAAQLDVPGSGQRAKARRRAIQKMHGYLEKHGTATKDDLLDLVDPDQVEYANRESFWANCVKGKPTLRQLPGVESPGPGGTTWRYVEDDV